MKINYWQMPMKKVFKKPKKPLLTIGGNKYKSGMLSDSDGDGYNDPIDCDPHDPNKQGKVWDAIKGTAGKVKERVVQVDEYLQEKGKQGREKKAQKYKERAEIMRAKREYETERTATEKVRMSGQRARVEVGERKQLLIERRNRSMPSMFSNINPMNPSGVDPMSPFGKPTKKRKKRTKKKAKKAKYKYIKVKA